MLGFTHLRRSRDRPRATRVFQLSGHGDRRGTEWDTRAVATVRACGTLDMPHHTDTALAPGTPARVVTGHRTVDISGAVPSTVDRAAFAVATAGGSRDAAHDEEGTEPLLARRSRTGVSIPILAVRILDAGHLGHGLLSPARCASSACPGTGQNTGAEEAERPPPIRGCSPEPRYAVERVPVHGDSPSRRRPSLSATPDRSRPFCLLLLHATSRLA
jgi:hypothetical protein